MPWSGGAFTRTHNWVNDYNASIDIQPDRHDEEDDNLAAGINACINKDGSNSFTGNADLNSNKIVNLAAGTGGNDAVNLTQLNLVKGDLKVKTADETVTNSSVFQDDDHLAGYSLVNGKRYEIDGFLDIGNGTGGGLKIKFDFTSSPTDGIFSALYYNESTSAPALARAATGNELSLSNLEASGINVPCTLKGTFISAGGTLDFQWAQAAPSPGIATTIKDGSFIRITQLD